MGKLSKKAKIIWGIIISIIIFLILSFHFKWINFYFEFTKGPKDSLSSVEKMIGTEIKESTPIIDELLLKYNQKEYDYIYDNMFDESVKEKFPKKQYDEIIIKVYDIFGQYISYDLEKAMIYVSKNNNDIRKISVSMPARFEKFENSTIEVSLISKDNNKFKLEGFKFNFKP